MKKENLPQVEIQVTLTVRECEDCPFHEARKVWTEDSWDQVRAIKCNKLNRDVYEYLDWYDKSPVPDECPIRA